MAKSKSSDDDLLSEGRKAFEQAVSAEAENRETALDDIKFARASDQWPDEVRKQRQIDGRPCLTINKLPAYIRQVVNDARQNKPSIKVHPVDSGADVKTAKIIDGLIRNIEYTSNADISYDTAVECAVSGGFGYWRVGLDYAYDDAFDMDIQIQRISNPFCVYGDPNSRAADSSDWDVAFVTDRLTKAQYEAEYGDSKSKVDWDDQAWSGLNGAEWLNDDGVLVAEWWTREHVDEEIQLFVDLRSGQPIALNAEGLKDEDNQALIGAGVLQFRQKRMGKSCRVKQRVMSGAEMLKEEDWVGKYIPVVPVYGDEFDIEGKRYLRSLIHNAVDAQRMFNYWRTASTELVALAPRVPYIGPKGAFDDDIDRWNTANTKSHPFLEFTGQVPPQRQPMDMGVAAGALQEALNASDDIKAIVGMYDASLGARSNETSGRAIMARQREGDVSTFHFMDNLARAIRHTGRIIIDLIPKVYNAPRIVRVIGEDGSQSAQAVNEPAPEVDEKGQPVKDEMGQAVMALHDLRVGKYDLTVSTGPSFTTRREEAAFNMTELVRAFPQSAPIVAPLLAKNLDWPGADELAEKFEQMASGQLPPEAQKMMEQGKQMIAKLQEENQKLKMDRSLDEAELAQKQQQAQVEARNKVQVAMIDIEAEKQIAFAKIEAQKEIDTYKAQLNAAAQASRPVAPQRAA